MRRSVLVLACAAVVLGASAAHAQQSPSGSPGGSPVGSPAQPGQSAQLGATEAAPGTTPPASPDAGSGASVTGQAPVPGFSVLGIPGTINAPVAAPYSNSAYGNLAGQPQRSGDWLLNWRRDRD